MLISILRILFALFLLYTWFYILHWLVGLGISLYTQADFPRRKAAVRWLLPNSQVPPVSVIIAAHNEEACIVDTLETLLREDYPGLEIIVVDDGSLDNTAGKIIDAFGLHPDRCESEIPIRECYRGTAGDRSLILLRKEKGGKARALNCGLGICRGKYCLVLDADTQVRRGAIRAMAGRFLQDPRTVVCAGAVGNNDSVYHRLPLLQKCLVQFQTLEYYRTFYMQRIFLDRLNANIVVSGAFALFDVQLLKQMGGYQENTIGEDMELAMRLHAFCQSTGREYRIAYAPEAKCTTQLPYRYRDFCRQRRRWQIGMIQSLHVHRYMLLNAHYGWAGILAGSQFLLYELFAPFIELLGLLTLVLSFAVGILHIGPVLQILLGYYLLMLLTQAVLVLSLNTYGAEKIPLPKLLGLLLMAILEFCSFHLINAGVKILAIATFRKHKATWQHIRRAHETVKQ